MTDFNVEPPAPPPYVWTAQMPYIWAGLIVMLIAALFIIALLYLRPELDPLILISTVAGIGGTIFTGVAAYLKGGQVHSTVNGQLAAWKLAAIEAAHTRGVMHGIAIEQARVAKAPPP